MIAFTMERVKPSAIWRRSRDGMADLQFLFNRNDQPAKAAKNIV